MARLAAAMAGDGRMPVPTLAPAYAGIPGAGPASPSDPDRAFASGVAASLQAVTPRFDQLAGWTGLATPKETGDQSLSWFVGYAPADSPRFAIVVVVEDSDEGVTRTLPIARQMLASMSP
jgi:hypothetical protein